MWISWSDMVHGCRYGVYKTRAETAAVSCGTSHASSVSTPLRWIFKNAVWKASHSSRITCERSESTRERRIALYKSDQQHGGGTDTAKRVRGEDNYPYVPAGTETLDLSITSPTLYHWAIPAPHKRITDQSNDANPKNKKNAKQSSDKQQKTNKNFKKKYNPSN